MISVPQSQSIENQLQKVLAMLSKRQPAKGWEQYLGGAGLVWEKVALAGQSQGGGHAALIARDHRVARVLLFGAPKDYDPRRQKPAAWYRPGSTPAGRFFALVHTRDEQGCTFQQQLEIYKSMGMDGKRVDVDTAAAPFGNAHVLVTSYPGRPIPSKTAHTLGISNPRFKEAWTYMLTADSETTGKED